MGVLVPVMYLCGVVQILNGIGTTTDISGGLLLLGVGSLLAKADQKP
jgi:hypothetical protein